MPFDEIKAADLEPTAAFAERMDSIDPLSSFRDAFNRLIVFRGNRILR